MFDIVGTEKVTAHLIIHPLEKIPDLPHRIPDAQGNHPVDDNDVIEVDPEGDFLLPARQQFQVHAL
jgi:hypothetical protein